MLKARHLHALALPLRCGGEATLVQTGDEWENMVKFRCISPPPLYGNQIIATQELSVSPLKAAFGRIFDSGANQTWVVVMASPEFEEELAKEPPGGSSHAA